MAKKPAAPRAPRAPIATGGAAVETRKRVFAERYLVNGNNTAEAAIFAGYSAHTAATKGWQLIRDPFVLEVLGDRAKALLHKAQLSSERWAEEMAAIGHFDPGDLYDEDGNLIPLKQLPEHVRRAIASVDVERRKEGKGENATIVETTKIKVNDKNTALANIGKHLGMFSEDNRQKVQAIQVNVVLRG